MRGFSKIMLITALVAGGVGIGLCTAGVAMGASSEIENFLTDSNGRATLVGTVVNSVFDGSALAWNKEWDEWQEDVEESSVLNPMEEDGDKIYETKLPDELTVCMVYDSVVFQEYDGNEIKIEVEGDGEDNVRVSLEDGELVIESRKKAEDRCVTVFYPAGTVFDEVSVDMKAGTVELDGALEAEDMELSVGAGSFEGTEKLKASELELNVGTGEMVLDLVDAEDIEADCGVGTLELTLAGSSVDYSYRLSTGVGSILYGDEEYSGLGMESAETIENAERSVDMECGVGEIDVSFEE